MTSGNKIIEITERYSAHNYHPLPIVIEKATGIWVMDPDGRKYMDMLSAYSALSHGHCHPEIVEALKQQAERVAVTSRAFHNDQLGPYAQELTALCGMDMMLPMNTGVEAVETAVKAARKWGYCVKGVKRYDAEIIVCDNNFHGRTISVISFSTEPLYRDDFGPFTPGFKVIPYGDADALEAAITPNTVAFLVEPIQGEAGVVVPPAGYLKQARDICDRHRVLLVADEIQTGLARTGRMFAFQHEDIQVDMMTLGKALGGGILPVSAVVGSREVMGLFTAGEHGSTFGGNPLSCAVARKALEILTRDRLAERAHELGEYFMDRLRAIRSPHINHIRGKGLLIGVVLKKEAGGARRFCEALMEEGILCKETHEDVIRFAPPLIIEKSEIDLAVDKARKVLEN